MTWTQTEHGDWRRGDGGLVAHNRVKDHWMGAIPSKRGAIPIVLRDGKQIRKFPTAEAAMAAVDQASPPVPAKAGNHAEEEKRG